MPVSFPTVAKEWREFHIMDINTIGQEFPSQGLMMMMSGAKAPATASMFRSTNKKARRKEPAGFRYHTSRYYIGPVLHRDCQFGVLDATATTADSLSLLTSTGFS